MSFKLLLNFILSLVTFAHAVPRNSRQSIQKDGIDRASPGDKILVQQGRYKERLLITKNGISLIGHNAVLVPPSDGDVNDNDCSGYCGPGTHAGICVAGSGIEADGFTVEHRKVRSVRAPVADVLVQGFHVEGFDVGPSVMILGAQNARFQGNTIVGGLNSLYGFLSAGSVNTVMSENVIRGSEDPSSFSFVAACNDNLDGTKVMDNELSGYFIGFCIQTSHSYFSDNRVHGTCAGAFVDPYVTNVTFRDNEIGPSFPACGGFGAWGVFVSGAAGTKIVDNQFQSISNSIGPSAGVNIEDERCVQESLACDSNGGKPVAATNNQVSKNSFSNNTLDLRLVSSGANNVFRHNKCKTSEPSGLCGGA